VGDSHYRLTAPEGRRDNFKETVNRKWKFIIDTAVENDIDLILQPGDLFDKGAINSSVLPEFTNILLDLEKHHIELITIFGQHDLLMRSENVNTTHTGYLNGIGFLHVAGKELIIAKTMSVYGNNFGDDYVFNLDKKDKYRILLTHDMIGDVPLYPGQDLTDAEQFLKKHSEFDLIVCGDYHYPYHYFFENRHIINVGCMLRLSRDERDMNRTPQIAIVTVNPNTFETSFEFIDLPIEPVEKVFIPKINKVEYKHNDLDLFIEKLKRKDKVGIGYLEHLTAYYKENDVSEDVRELILEVLK
jgi:DNA repair exonuclease SbcCD nuclease subunit